MYPKYCIVLLQKNNKQITKKMQNMLETYMQRNEECFKFTLTDHLKQDRPGKVFGNVHLYKYPVKELCVYETLNYFPKATENF